jgi:hypothetical protein
MKCNEIWKSSVKNTTERFIYSKTNTEDNDKINNNNDISLSSQIMHSL